MTDVEKNKIMTILITGVAGFIGSNLADRLLRECKYRVIGIDNLSYGVREQIPDGVEFHKADIRSKEMYPFFEGVDCVFHFAAKNCISDCQLDPVETADINVTGTVNVFEAARRANVKKVIYAESSAMYEGSTILPTPETEVKPQSFYALSKLASMYFAEGYARFFGADSPGSPLSSSPDLHVSTSPNLKVSQSHSHQVSESPSLMVSESQSPKVPESPSPQVYDSLFPPVSKSQSPKVPESPLLQVSPSPSLTFTALRYFCVYGPRQDYRRSIPPVFSAFIIKLLKGEQPVIYGTGEKRRDFVYVDDVNDFHMQCLSDRRTDGRVFNLGSGRNYSVNEIYEIIANLLNSEIEPVYKLDLPGEAFANLADITEVRKLGWKPSTELSMGLKAAIDFIKKEIGKGKL
jgi:nucleoside-diphosphate-sugar epimerase